MPVESTEVALSCVDPLDFDSAAPDAEEESAGGAIEKDHAPPLIFVGLAMRPCCI